MSVTIITKLGSFNVFCFDYCESIDMVYMYFCLLAVNLLKKIVCGMKSKNINISYTGWLYYLIYLIVNIVAKRMYQYSVHS